jgi:FkbM family methyltransferase
MKESIKRLLKRLNIYYRLKYSTVFTLYEGLFKPETRALHRKEVRLYKSFLDSPDMIFDIGAYDGHKTAAFAEISSKVISCEPDPDSFQILTTRFRNLKSKVQLINCAVYNRQGKAVLQRNSKGSAFNTLNPEWKNILEKDNVKRWSEKIRFEKEIEVEVRTNTLDHLIGQYGIPDFIKIDVEGSELEVIQGLTQQVKYISFECLLPEFSSQLIQILDNLMSLNNRYHFNVIYNEELLLPEALTHAGILQWIKTTELNCFDMLAVLK